MKTDLRFSLPDIISGRFEKAVIAMVSPIARAGTKAMDDVAKIVKTDGRSDIARAGFSRRWQNALRVDRYPKGRRVSVDAAVFVYHRIRYAGVFEQGANIQGSPLLWLRLSGTPKRIGNNRMTPSVFGRLIGPLVSLISRSGNPLLAASIRVPKSQANSDRPKVTLAALRRGSGSGTGVLRTVPLFVGIRGVNIRKQLNIREICERTQGRIPSLYSAHFEANNGP